MQESTKCGGVLSKSSNGHTRLDSFLYLKTDSEKGLETWYYIESLRMNCSEKEHFTDSGVSNFFGGGAQSATTVIVSFS